MTANGFVSPDRRIRLLAQPAVAPTQPELEAVFVGMAAPNANFAAASAALAAAASLGFTPASGDVSLSGLPLAFTDAGSFAMAFPGDDSWLARAVNDFFAAGGLKAWVVRVQSNPADPLDAYVRATPFPISLVPQSGFEIAARVMSAGLVAFPDLEADCLASAAPPTLPAPPTELASFRPLDTYSAPQENSGAATQSSQPAQPVAPFDALSRLSQSLAALRTDMICLFALPIGADSTQSEAALVARAIAYVRGVTVGPGAIPRVLGGSDLPQFQVFAPLLRDALGRTASPTGLVAGLLCARAETAGVWRSAAGATLPLGATPLRRIESNALAELRACGVVALAFNQGATTLDDDTMACQQHQPNSAMLRAAGGRRLMGWLVRQLTSFGEQLVFENVLDDGRVELALTTLFAELFKQGALQGGQVSDAVRMTRRLPPPGANAYALDIWVATAVAVETIRLQILDGAVTASLGAAA